MLTVVTGGSGRLGRVVVAGLAEAGHEVVSVDRPGSSAPAGASATREVDLTDPARARAVLADVRPEAVVHLAAIAVPFSRPEPEILTTNAALAWNVCDAAVEHGVKRVVVASSPTVVGYGAPAGWRPERLPIDEDHPVRPWNAYGLSKLVAEQVVRTTVARVGDDVRLSAFRPCYVIAPDEWEGAPTQAGHTVRERLDSPELAAPALFNYLDARDAADLVGLLLTKADHITNGEVFFASAPDALARRPLSELLPEHHPGTAGLADALVGTASAFSSAKAERVLGWRPHRSWRTELH